MKSRESLIRLKRFQVDEKRRTVTQIETMIGEFERNIADLNTQIESEQARSGITDPTHYAYPTFAKAAMQRRENLVTSIDDLKQQLDHARADLGEAFEELKKFELLEERTQRQLRLDEQRAEQSDLDEAAGRLVNRGSAY